MVIEIEAALPKKVNVLTIGVQGPPGATGNPGPQGETGPKGADSYVVGPQGPMGPAGPQGDIGPVGATGAASTVPGPQGEIGPQGIPGIQGNIGPQGDTGLAGESAYSTAVSAGFVGTEAEWLASLVGPEGPQGIQGIPGTDGGGTTEVTHTLITMPGYGVVPNATVADYIGLDAYAIADHWIEVTTGETGVELFYLGWDRLYGPFQPWLKNPKYLFGTNGETRLVVNVDRALCVHPNNSTKYVGPVETTATADEWAQIRTAMSVPIHFDATLLAVDTKYTLVNADGRTDWVLAVGLGSYQGGTRNHPLWPLRQNDKASALLGETSSMSFSKDAGDALWLDGASYPGLAGLPSRYTGTSTNYSHFLGTWASTNTGILEWDYKSVSNLVPMAASQIEMEEGTESASRLMSPLGVAQAIAALADSVSWAGIADKPAVAVVDAAQTFAGAQRGAVTTLTSTAASMAIDLATNNNFNHTTTENTTLAAPSNPVAGQSGVITITQGATARLLAYNTFWKFPGGTVPTLTAVVGAVDVLAYNVESATRATCQLLKDVK